MIGFPGMLIGPAEKAGISVPENEEDYDPDKFPHWHVYLSAQLGTGLPHPAAHWDNAHVVASFPEDRIRKVTAADLISAGFAAIV